ncbi:MAG: TROVE domain-containing protein [Ktedonobacterales bacterium]
MAEDISMNVRTGKGKINRLLGKSAYDGTLETNYEGAPSFVRGDEEALIRVLMTGTFESTFYSSDVALTKEAVAIFGDWAARNPRFLAQGIVYARREGLLRLVPITALVMLSAAPSEEAKRLFRAIFARVIRTPGDLQDFLTLCRQGTLRGMGKSVQHAAASWLAEMSQYHAIKYGSEAQQMSLRDCYRLTRPKLTGEANAIARYLVKGEVSEDLRQIAGYEAFKRLAREKGHDSEALTLVQEYRLPWEVVTAHLRGAAAWEAMLAQMPYMALVRNLNNLIKYGVVSKPEVRDSIAQTIANPERVADSKMLPFQFYSALKMVAGDDEPALTLRAALETALEHSFVSMPHLGQRVLVANDISGSMSAKPSARSEMTMAEIAGIFAAAVFKKAEAGTIVSFDTAAHPRDVSKSESLADIARKVAQFSGGTSLSAPLEYAFGGNNGRHKYDVAVFITDSESWYDHITHNRGVLDLIREYRARVNPDLLCFFVQLLPYKHAVAPESEPGLYYLYGWSASILPFIASVSQAGKGQVDVVRQVVLD